MVFLFGPPALVFSFYLLFFFFNDTATTEIYTLSLHDALPIAAPWSALFPEARDRAIAPLSAFWATAWILALRLVTRSSPLAGGDCLTVPVTSPAALTDTTWVPARPRSWLSYWASRPAWPTRSTPEKPVTGRWRLLISSGVMGCR